MAQPGQLGIFGFFVVSGYSIAASLERSESGFYRRRFVRIWPLYLGCIAFGLVVSLWAPAGITWPTGGRLPPATTASVVASLVMLQDIVAPAIPIVGQIWSLSPEWWHYGAAPKLQECSTTLLITLIGASFAAFMLISNPPGQGPEGLRWGLSTLTLSWLWVSGFVYRRLDGKPIGIAILLIPSTYALFFGHFTGAPAVHFIVRAVLELRANVDCPPNSRLQLSRRFELPAVPLPHTGHGSFASPGTRASWIMVAGSLLVATAALYGIDYPARSRFRSRGKSRNDVTLAQTG